MNTSRPSSSQRAASPDFITLLQAVARSAQEAGVFGEVRLEGARLVCTAANAAEPAEYRVDTDGGTVWVSLVTANRWLSESIESDLMHTGDDLEELIEEELVEQGFTGGRLPYEHYRSEDKLFTFRSPVPVRLDEARAAQITTQCLLAYEACFRQLGDMDASEDED